MDKVERTVKEFIQKTQWDAFIETAEKAEMEGKREKALDQYREALYFLKHREIDSQLQAANVPVLEAKIADLEKSS